MGLDPSPELVAISMGEAGAGTTWENKKALHWKPCLVLSQDTGPPPQIHMLLCSSRGVSGEA